MPSTRLTARAAATILGAVRELLLVAVALALAVPGVSARQKDVGFGVEYVLTVKPVGGPVRALHGFAVTGSPPVLPAVLGVALSFAPGYLHLCLTGDWWLIQLGLDGPVGLYLGPGLSWGANIGGAGAVSFGARAVIGLQFFPTEILELFLEAGVNVGVYVGPSGAGLSWGAPAGVGARLWF